MFRVTFIVSALIVLGTANLASAAAHMPRKHPVAKIDAAQSASSRSSAWDSYRRCRWTWPRNPRLWCRLPAQFAIRTNHPQ
jgi:hypothetical protein